MSRVTYKQLKDWITNYNNYNVHKVELSAFNDAYWIYDAETGNRIICNESPSVTWKMFCIWKDGYRTALEDVRAEKINPNE